MTLETVSFCCGGPTTNMYCWSKKCIAAWPSWQSVFRKILMSNQVKENTILCDVSHTNTQALIHKTRKKMFEWSPSRVRSQLLSNDSRWCVVLTSTFIVAVWSASAVKRNQSHIALIYSAILLGQGVTTDPVRQKSNYWSTDSDACMIISAK